MRTCIVVFTFLLSISSNTLSNQSVALSEADIGQLSLDMFVVHGPKKAEIVGKLASTQDKSLIPTLVLAMRWTGANVHVAKALSELAGETITTWHDAYNWQERHPEIVPHPTYRDIKLHFLGNTDARFLDLFKPPYGNRENMRIRLEEIVWGGALYDDIPSLDFADMVKPGEADYLLESDLVFGVEINGDARAYPLRIMGWHEMVNDVIGGVPVALAYCTLCGSGILYETQIKDRDGPFVFGSSGLLYRSNKLMFDRQTNSVWNQFSGEPVFGPLVDSGIKLKTLPISITSWSKWHEQHPDTRVLSVDTGHIRNYESGFVYHDYFASPDLMFPAVVRDESELLRKDYVFGMRQFAASKAWPLEAFTETSVINDTLGDTPIVLIGDPSTRTVRAYERQVDEIFSESADGALIAKHAEWQINEEFLTIASDGNNPTRRARLPGHVSYWFAWENFMHDSDGLSSQGTQ